MRMIFLLIVALMSWTSLMADNVGLLIMATGKYISFVPPLVKSAKRHFCKKHKVTFFVFTDSKRLPADDQIVYIHQKRLGWPYDTMMRYHVYVANQGVLAKQDYLFSIDADMLFVDTVGDEILSERVATLSPGFTYGSPYPRIRGAFETNPLSTAYVRDDEGGDYFAGGFQGGTSKEFLKMARTNAANIDKDLAHGIIAEVHDESHLNRYYIDHPPTLVLSPSYCYPENWTIPYHKRLLALDKDHEALRQ